MAFSCRKVAVSTASEGAEVGREVGSMSQYTVAPDACAAAYVSLCCPSPSFSSLPLPRRTPTPQWPSAEGCASCSAHVSCRRAFWASRPPPASACSSRAGASFDAQQSPLLSLSLSHPYVHKLRQERRGAASSHSTPRLFVAAWRGVVEEGDDGCAPLPSPSRLSLPCSALQRRTAYGADGAKK